MNSREVGFLVFRIAGLYLLLKAFIYFLNAWPGLIAMIVSHNDYGDYPMGGILVAYIINLGLFIVGGWFLITRSGRLAEFWFPKWNDEESPIPSPIDFNKIQILAFSIVGLLVIVHAVPVVVGGLITLLTSPIPGWVDGSHLTGTNMTTLSRLLASLIELLLGLWLFLGSRGLVNFWNRMRTAKYPERDANPKPVDVGPVE